MNLIEQFPDVSERVRAKRQIKKAKASVRMKPALSYDHQPVAGYHTPGFTSWHFKVLLIIAGSVFITYYALVNSPLLLR